MTVIKVNDLKSEEVFLKAKEINEKDSSHIIKAFTSLNSDSCFFSFLLNQINDYMHSDTYSEYRDIEGNIKLVKINFRNIWDELYNKWR